MPDEPKDAPVAAQPIVTDEMVTRFLAWRLPDDFAPDCGISFKPLGHPNGWPVGTNLLTATQAQQMLGYVLSGSIIEQPSVPELGSVVINEASWKFVEAMPHALPGPIFNDLKPALYAAVLHVLHNCTIPRAHGQEDQP